MPNKDQIINILYSWICILLILILCLVMMNIYLMRDIQSICPEIEKLNTSINKISSLIIFINKQCDIINNHVDNKRNVICETYKRDLKHVRYNGKIYTLISYNYDKGNKRMNQILKTNNDLKGIYFDCYTCEEIPYSDPIEAMRAFEEKMREEN